jgi:hypothetical protein
MKASSIRKGRVMLFGAALAAVAALVLASISTGGGDSSSANDGSTIYPSVRNCKPGTFFQHADQSNREVQNGRKIVLGCGGNSQTGRIVITAFRRSAQVCVSTELMRTGESRAGLCAFRGKPWAEQWCEDRSACVTGVGFGRERTNVSGVVPVTTASITVIRPNSEVSASAIGRAKGGVLAALKADEPFGYFYLELPGCHLDPDELELVWTDSRGHEGILEPNLAPQASCGK